MIIARAPLRLSFVGGGSDLPVFYETAPYGGAVVSCTINKYVYIVVNRHFDGGVRVAYSITENVERADQVRHELVRNSLKMMGVRDGIEVVSVADVPGRGSGLGSSSSFTVALLKALCKYTNKVLDKSLLAQSACEVEMRMCNSSAGKQDQYAATWGGLNFIKFTKDRVEVDRTITDLDTAIALNQHLMVFYTGKTRSSKKVLEDQSNNLFVDEDRRKNMMKMVDLAYDFRRALENGDIVTCGSLLDANWHLKKTMSEHISSPHIDNIYKQAQRAGAIGGKISGAGGGGFMFFVVPPDRHDDVRNSIPLKEVPVSLDFKGAEVVYA